MFCSDQKFKIAALRTITLADLTPGSVVLTRPGQQPGELHLVVTYRDVKHLLAIEGDSAFVLRYDWNWPLDSPMFAVQSPVFSVALKGRPIGYHFLPSTGWRGRLLVRETGPSVTTALHTRESGTEGIALLDLSTWTVTPVDLIEANEPALPPDGWGLLALMGDEEVTLTGE